MTSPTSSVTYAGDGSTRNFSVPFPYLDKSHVIVDLNGTVQSITWVNSSTVRLGSAPALGSTVTVRRDTPRLTPAVDFVDGSTLSERDLDAAVQQLLFVVQEAFDRYTTAAELLEDMVFQAEQVPPRQWDFVGDGETFSYTLPVAPVSAASLLVTIDGVTQTPGVAFDLSGQTVIFTETPPEDAEVIIRVFGYARNTADVKTALDAAADAQAALTTLQGIASTVQTSAANAATSETSAATSASQANTSATNAATARTGAETARDVASAARTAAETARDLALAAQAAAEQARDQAQDVAAAEAAAIIGAAPELLNTLQELSAALNNDPNFATTMANALANKASLVHTHAIGDTTGLQTALDGKAPKASPDFTVQITTPKVTTASGDLTLQSASGVVNITGAALVNGVDQTVQCIPIACSDESTALTTGTAKITFRMPYAFYLMGIKASLSAAQAGGSVLTVDVNVNGSSIFSTRLTINNGSKTSVGSTAPVIITPNLADDVEVTVDIDQVGDGSAKGLKLYLIGRKAA